MKNRYSTLHSFFIPVMGTGFTIDTPIKVAKYGINSVISLVDDVLIESMRKYHSHKAGLPYEPITDKHHDARAARITSYLNLLKYLVDCQVAKLRNSPFVSGSEITRYYQLLPDSNLKSVYERMMKEPSETERKKLESTLREAITPGRIDVNIMTKLDATRKRGLKTEHTHPSDALSALRGFAQSDLISAVIFSAGLNPRLYQYAGQFNDFFPGEDGHFQKKIIIKVSDFRSALIQGRFLAKKGLWVSEFRIESGLNCGGHAFASDGQLMGPILQEFSQRRFELQETMEKVWHKSIEKLDRIRPDEPPALHITAQGGVGTANEHRFLVEQFGIDEVGWGTPFLLVPEATNVDEEHIEKLIAAKSKDIVLSDSSPLGIPFWNLINSTSEKEKRRRMIEEKPGSPCPKKYAITNTEFTDHAICTASRAYQTLKIKQLNLQSLSPDRKESMMEKITTKSCICHDLSGVATLKLNLLKKAFPAICAGPNMSFFTKKATLKNMVDHIYGRLSLLKNNNRPNMFINELKINFDWISKEFDSYKKQISDKPIQYFQTFKKNLSEGIDEYSKIAESMIEEHREMFLAELKELEIKIETLFMVLQEPATV